MIDQPFSQRDILEFHRHMQERRSIQRRTVEPIALLYAQLFWKNLTFGEAAIQDARLSPQYRIQQINPPAMDSHRRCIGELKPSIGKDLQTRVLALRVPRIRANEHLHKIAVLRAGNIRIRTMSNEPLERVGRKSLARSANDWISTGPQCVYIRTKLHEELHHWNAVVRKCGTHQRPVAALMHIGPVFEHPPCNL